MAERIAVIADVHGNTWALDAVLDDLSRRSVDVVLNLGDSVYSSLDPAGAAERLMQADIISISGNEDRVVFDPPPGVENTWDHQFVTSQLSAVQMDWLRAQPKTWSLGDVFLCHGTPNSDTIYLLETMTEQGVFLSDSETIASHLDGIGADVILCGHSHVPRIVWLPDGRLIVNPGSVGIPAYTDDHPYPHAMEAGSPHTRYAILNRGEMGWNVEQITLPYRWDVAAATARHYNRPDRAAWIETGRASL